jgi:hypothetical protein
MFEKNQLVEHMRRRVQEIGSLINVEQFSALCEPNFESEMQKNLSDELIF